MKITRLVTLLALLTFSVHATEAHADPGYDQYASSTYDYCDALVLGGFWGVGTSDAKSAIGNKLISGNQSTLDSVLNSARMAAANNMANRDLHCSYDLIGIHYTDAEALAAYWGIDTWEAKMRVEEKYLRDGHKRTHIDEALRIATASSKPDPMTAYVNSDYEYCDAKVLSKVWGRSVNDSKTKIGQLITSDPGTLASTLGSAQMAAANNMANRDLRCEYHEIGISYEDAEALAAYWSTDTWEAKMRVEEKYLRDGHKRTHIDEALQSARGM